MRKKCLAITIIAVVIIGAGAFYFGTTYEKSSLSKQGLLRGGNNGAGFQGGGRQGGAQGGGQRGGNNGNGDFAAGDIISKDDKSVTVKTRNGGSQIVYFSGSTTIGKTVQGASSDLNVGQQVMANGKNNPDGSLAAQNIQIRPADSAQ
ncbi:MAG: DUF5666 domain-containing protein [bacterium]|nr:DUF5666 domain-containing protein [bacterium]